MAEIVRTWYFQLNGDVFGPFTEAELRSKASSGEINSNVRVRNGSEGNWIGADELSGLFGSTNEATGQIPDSTLSRPENRKRREPPPLPSALPVTHHRFTKPTSEQIRAAANATTVLLVILAVILACTVSPLFWFWAFTALVGFFLTLDRSDTQFKKRRAKSDLAIQQQEQMGTTVMADDPTCRLMPCPDCGHHVSKRAHSCPSCGCPVVTRKEQSGQSRQDSAFQERDWVLWKPRESDKKPDPSQSLGCIGIIVACLFVALLMGRCNSSRHEAPLTPDEQRASDVFQDGGADPVTADEAARKLKRMLERDRERGR